MLVERQEATLIISVNRPDQRNAVDLSVAEGIAAAVSELEGDPQLRVGVLHGVGGVFSAGMDLKAFARGERPHVPGRGFAGIVEVPPAKPTIAAIEGFAVGGGLEIALACDLIVAASGARLGLPEAKRGLIARGGAAFRLPSRIPRAIALEMLLTGEFISAERAAQCGLVNRVVADGEALNAALKLAHVIAGNAPLAVAAVKRVADEASQWSADEAFRRQAEIVQPVFESEDAAEGARAFREKRAPVWLGR